MTYPTSSTELADQPVRIERFLELVAPKLQLVEEELRRNFISPIRTINEVGDHIVQGGGKRLRPLLLLLTANMLGYRGSKDIVYAVVVEFIHTATLVHDDIIDEAAVRRGRTSINYRWGNHLTVLVGDYLYTHSMNMALIEGNLDILRLLSGITIRMTEGEIIGLEQNGRLDLSIDDYLGIVGRKTAALFGASCQIPGYLVDADPATSEALYNYGYNLGICFQLIDDLLDFTSSTEVLGKPVLSDLKEGKLTLPLILTLPRCNEGERRLIEKVATERTFGVVDPADILRIAEKYDGIDQTREFASEYAERARHAIAHLPESSAHEALEFALEFVQSRTH